MPTLVQLRSADRHYRLSALLARRAVTEARKARSRGAQAVIAAIVTHQAAQAVMSETAVAQMLAEQDIEAAAEALLNSLAFTTDTQALVGMIDAAADDMAFDRLVESIVQDAGRAAESVATAVRPNIWHVRYLSPPSCARCAILAGRVYRYSEGFQRHPNCDCVMIPTTVAGPYAQNPTEMVERGLVTGLSKADLRAIADGADLNRVVNVRLRKAGLTQSGRVLARAGRPTPEGIYASTNTREEAVAAFKAAGYLL